MRQVKYQRNNTLFPETIYYLQSTIFFLIEIRFEVYKGGVQREAVVRQTTGAFNRRIGGDGVQ